MIWTNHFSLWSAHLLCWHGLMASTFFWVIRRRGRPDRNCSICLCFAICDVSLQTFKIFEKFVGCLLLNSAIRLYFYKLPPKNMKIDTFVYVERYTYQNVNSTRRSSIREWQYFWQLHNVYFLRNFNTCKNFILCFFFFLNKWRLPKEDFMPGRGPLHGWPSCYICPSTRYV